MALEFEGLTEKIIGAAIEVHANSVLGFWSRFMRTRW